MRRVTVCTFCGKRLSWVSDTCYSCGVSWSKGDRKGRLFETRSLGRWIPAPEGCLVTQGGEEQT